MRVGKNWENYRNRKKFGVETSADGHQRENRQIIIIIIISIISITCSEVNQ